MSQTGTQAVADTRKKPGGKKAIQAMMDVFGLDPKTMSPADRRTAISGYDLRYRIEALVAGVTAKKIKHVYQGDGAATAPGLMILPRIPATHLFPMRHVRILLGYTAHEIDHQLVTDFDLLTAMVNDTAIPIKRRQQIKEFWNAIEDYRIEKVTRREYPGFHSFIDDTRDFSAERFCERVDAGLVPAKALSNPYRMGAVALTWIGADLNAYRTRRPADALSRLDGQLVLWLESWRADLKAVETCLEARDLAVRILDELDRLRQQQPDDENEESSDKPKDQKGGKQGQGDKSQAQKTDDDAQESADKSPSDTGSPDTNDEEQKSDKPGDSDENDEAQGGEEPDEGNSGGDTQQENDGSNGTPGEDQQDQSDGSSGEGGASGESGQHEPGDDADNNGDEDDNDDTQGEDEDGCGDQSAKRPDLEVNDGDEEDEAEKADLDIDELTKVINSMKGSEAKDPKITEGDTIARGMRGDGNEAAKMQSVKRGQSAYAKLRQETGGAATRSAGILRRMLQSQTRRTWQGGKEEGHLDMSRIVPILQGSTDIYRQRVDRQGVNTAVYLLMDNSGSMGGYPIQVCQQTAVVLDMAIQGTRTNVEITGFTGNADNPVLYRYRAFGEKGQMASASLGNMDQVILGGTPVSTPLLEAWRRLQQQKEPRRILIVVSDGGADWNDIQPSRDAHDFIIRQGCTIIGIAIGEDQAMKQWCDNTVAINNIDDLPVALTTLVQEALK